MDDMEQRYISEWQAIEGKINRHLDPDDPYDANREWEEDDLELLAADDDDAIDTCVDAHCSSTERSSTERSSTERSSTESADGTAESESDNADTKQENDTMDMTPEMLAMLKVVAAEAVAENDKSHKAQIAKLEKQIAAANASAPTAVVSPTWQYEIYTAASKRKYVHLRRLNASRDAYSHLTVGSWPIENDSPELRTAVEAASPIERMRMKKDERGRFTVSREEIDGAFAIEINARLTPEIDTLIDAATGNKPTSAAQKQGAARKTREAKSTNGAASPRKQAAKIAQDMRRDDPQVSYQDIIIAVDTAGLCKKDGSKYGESPRIDSTVYGLLKVNLDK